MTRLALLALALVLLGGCSLGPGGSGRDGEDGDPGGGSVEARELKQQADRLGRDVFPALAAQVGGTLQPMPAQFTECNVRGRHQYRANSQVRDVTGDAAEVTGQVEQVLRDAGLEPERLDTGVAGSRGDVRVTVTVPPREAGQPVGVLLVNLGSPCRPLDDPEWALQQAPVDLAG